MARATEKPAERSPQREHSASDVSLWQYGLATAAALLIGALYLLLPQALLLGPRWLLLMIEVALLTPPIVARLTERYLPHRVGRWLAYGLLAALTVALIASVGKLVLNLAILKPPQLLLTSGILLWTANVLVFASWETDGDGPVSRHRAGHQAADFQFPQQVGGNTRGWRAGFVDYLFLAFCTATALSPADTVPLTHRAKLLMITESVISMGIIALLIARFVNVV